MFNVRLTRPFLRHRPALLPLLFVAAATGCVSPGAGGGTGGSASGGRSGATGGAGAAPAGTGGMGVSGTGGTLGSGGAAAGGSGSATGGVNGQAGAPGAGGVGGSAAAGSGALGGIGGPGNNGGAGAGGRAAGGNGGTRVGGNGGTRVGGNGGAGSDAQAPSTPGGVMISAVTCNSATLTWTAATDNVGVAFYDIYHDGQMMKSVAGNTLTTTLVLAPGASWGIYVNARDAAGNVSQASPSVPVMPPQCQADTQAPTAPTMLMGTVSGTTVTLRWTASTDNIGVAAYDIFRNGTKAGMVTGTGTTAPPTMFIDSGLAASTTFVYTVVARDAQANVSPSSNMVSLMTGAACTSVVCEVRQLTTDTDVPWGLVTLPDGMVLYGRRDAQDIVRLNPANGQKTTVGRVPNVQGTDGEGGLMGLEIASTFATDGWLYIMHTSPSDNRIVRMKVTSAGTLDAASHQVLLGGLLRNKFHNGGRLRFGPDGKLYITIGDAQNGANAQNTAILAGKILRINPDGTVPTDNPFSNAVWSYGHRNPQGLAFDSQGRLWEQEFGNSIMDETNLIQKGGNYGWPACEGTSGTCGTAGYIAPKRTYTTAEGSCSGIAIVRDVLYVACQRGTRLYRGVISGTSLTGVQQFFSGTYGRLRTVEPAPDGGLWLTTTNTGDKDNTANNSNERIFHVTLGN